MVRTHRAQTSLNGGELSPLLYARPDLEAYANGLARCANFIPLVQGGVKRRPGTRFVAEVKDSANPPKLIEFVFSRLQSYILEFGEEYVRFYMNGGQLFDETPNYVIETEAENPLLTESGEALRTEQVDPTVAPYELISPYTATEVQELQFSQTADVMFMTHPSHPIRTLTRTGHTSWTFAEYQYENGPFLEYNFDDDHTITASGETGVVTLTSNKDIFDAGHVNSLFYLEEETNTDYNTWETDVGFDLNDIVFWDGNVYQAVQKNGNSGQVAPVHLEGDRWDGQKESSILWRYLHSGHGIVRITGFTSARQVTAIVLNRLPSTLTSGTKHWREGAWSDYRGWPKAVAMFEQRLWFSGTDHRPQTIWSSVAGNFFDFEFEAQADNAITYSINSRRATPIQAMSDNVVLNIFATGQEWAGQNAGSTAGLEQGNFSVRISTNEGSTDVTPINIGNTTLFIDESGYKLMELGYSLEYDGATASDLTLVAEHITKPGYFEVGDPVITLATPVTSSKTVVDSAPSGKVGFGDGSEADAETLSLSGRGITSMTWAKEPDAVLWATRSDGLLLGFTYNRQQQVKSWHRHPMENGAVLQVASISNSDTGNSQVWMLVTRSINGLSKVYVEYLLEDHIPSSSTDTDDYNYLDCSLTYEGSPADTITGLEHLESETVSVWADGARHSNRTVSSGSITLDGEYSTVHVGIHSQSFIKLLPGIGGIVNAQPLGHKRSYAEIRAWVKDAIGGKAGETTDNLDVMHYRAMDDNLGQTPALNQGVVKVTTSRSISENTEMYIVQDIPAPMTILSVVPVEEGAIR